MDSKDKWFQERLYFLFHFFFQFHVCPCLAVCWHVHLPAGAHRLDPLGDGAAGSWESPVSVQYRFLTAELSLWLPSPELPSIFFVKRDCGRVPGEPASTFPDGSLPLYSTPHRWSFIPSPFLYQQWKPQHYCVIFLTGLQSLRSLPNTPAHCDHLLQTPTYCHIV